MWRLIRPASCAGWSESSWLWFCSCCCAPAQLYESPPDKTNKKTQISLINVRMKKAWVLSYPLSPQKKTLIRLGGCPGWSVFAECPCHIVGFVVQWLIMSDLSIKLAGDNRNLQLPWFDSSVSHWWGQLILIEPRHEKTCFCHMQTTKAQISLCILTVLSVSLLFASAQSDQRLCCSLSG